MSVTSDPHSGVAGQVVEALVYDWSLREDECTCGGPLRSAGARPELWSAPGRTVLFRLYRVTVISCVR